MPFINIEVRKKYEKEWYLKNRERILKKQKEKKKIPEYNQKLKEIYHKYYIKNKDKFRQYFLKNKDRKNKWRKEKRHKLGISKRYRGEYLGISNTKEYRSWQRQKRRILIKKGGDLLLKTIQQVYEDNIKRYGTLTCYLCLQPIPFGKDHLEHKIPLSRGGTNLYENLAIACQSCNCKKHSKTEEEYREEIFHYGTKI